MLKFLHFETIMNVNKITFLTKIKNLSYKLTSSTKIGKGQVFYKNLKDKGLTDQKIKVYSLTY
jgi:hypothetical protein